MTPPFLARRVPGLPARVGDARSVFTARAALYDLRLLTLPPLPEAPAICVIRCYATCIVLLIVNLNLTTDCIFYLLRSSQ